MRGIAPTPPEYYALRVLRMLTEFRSAHAGIRGGGGGGGGGRDGQMRPLAHFWRPLHYSFLEHNAVNALQSGVNKCQREASMCACARKTLCRFAAPAIFAAIKSGPRE